jgi:hypothetical protein
MKCGPASKEHHTRLSMQLFARMLGIVAIYESPGRGEIVIFNRSHYEDVLVTRVHKLIDKAPWYVMPSNHKWFRDLAVSQIMADTMEELGMAFPEPSFDLAEIRRKYHAAREEERDHKKS